MKTASSAFAVCLLASVWSLACLASADGEEARKNNSSPEKPEGPIGCWSFNEMPGGFLNCDGSGETWKAPGSEGMNCSEAITVEAWIKPGDLDNPPKSSIAIAKSGSWMLRARNEHNYSLAFFVSVDGGLEPRIEWSYRDEEPDKWFHIVVTYENKASSKSLKLYIDGKLVGAMSRNGRIDSSRNPVQAGGGLDKSSPFKGCIGNIRIFDRALSPDEIQKAYSSSVKR